MISNQASILVRAYTFYMNKATIKSTHCERLIPSIEHTTTQKTFTITYLKMHRYKYCCH